MNGFTEYEPAPTPHIRSRERLRQIVSFANLRFGPGGRIRPTDVDGFLEIRDRLFVWLEVKYRDAPTEPKQRQAFELAARRINLSGAVAVVLIVSHEIDDPREDVDAAVAVVREYFFRDSWRTMAYPTTCYDFLENMISICEIQF